MKRLGYCAVLVSLLTACGTSERTYHTEIDAKNAGVFQRHFLPDVVPTSSREIYIQSKWWSRRASGVFSFDPRDRQAFFGRLQSNLDAGVWGDWSKVAPYLRSNGVAPLGYSSTHGRWLFFCTERQDCAVCTWTRL